VQHTRHYTIDQAQAVRGWVAARVRVVRGARAKLHALGPRARSAINALDPELGGAWPGRDVAEPLVELSRAVAELEAVEIVVRDVDRGLIDFPAIQPDDSGAAHDCGGAGCPARGTPEGREVYLCWLLDDEEEIAFWHGIEDGFAGRQPLP